MNQRTYNGLGKLLSQTANKNGDIKISSYTYDILGNRKTMSDETGVTSYLYDDLSRLLKETEPGNITKEYTYDANANRKAFLLKRNGTSEINISYNYDKLNRLDKVTESGQSYTYLYDKNSNREYFANPVTGINTQYQYNDASLLKQISNIKNSIEISKNAYTYYLDGNQRSKTNNKCGIFSYAYDGLGRLSAEIDPVKGDTVYQYNEYHDRVKMIGSDEQDSLEPDATYQYDQYNQLNRIDTEEKSSTYKYDGDGLRREKVSNGETVKYIYDGANIVMELDGAGNLKAKYIRGSELIYSADNTGNKRCYLYNGHGDVEQLTDASGNVIKEYRYDAFGNEQNPDTNDSNPFRYCGEYYDKETGFYYLRARYYDPKTGRFITEDSYEGQVTDPLSLNLYTYCNNNPIEYIDKDGHVPTVIIGAGVGALVGGGIELGKQLLNHEEVNWKKGGNISCVRCCNRCIGWDWRWNSCNSCR